jgi:hypothetical protein
VSATDAWEKSYLAVSLALGQSLDDALTSLGDEARERASVFARRLETASHEARAKVVAANLTRLAVAIEKARIA